METQLSIECWIADSRLIIQSIEILLILYTTYVVATLSWSTWKGREFPDKSHNLAHIYTKVPGKFTSPPHLYKRDFVYRLSGLLRLVGLRGPPEKLQNCINTLYFEKVTAVRNTCWWNTVETTFNSDQSRMPFVPCIAPTSFEC